jgi:hypothetical protein
MAPGQHCNVMRTARVTLQIEPKLKSAGEKVAAAQHRSLAELIEKLLADYCKKQTAAPAKVRSRADEASKAAEMAGKAIDDVGDKTLAPPERQRRKRRLIHGPQEFREMRRK